MTVQKGQKKRMNETESIRDPLFLKPIAQTPATEHKHRFCFALSEHKVLRGCEICGKAWIARHDGVVIATWAEVSEERL